MLRMVVRIPCILKSGLFVVTLEEGISVMKIVRGGPNQAMSQAESRTKRNQTWKCCKVGINCLASTQ